MKKVANLYRVRWLEEDFVRETIEFVMTELNGQGCDTSRTTAKTPASDLDGRSLVEQTCWRQVQHQSRLVKPRDTLVYHFVDKAEGNGLVSG